MLVTEREVRIRQSLSMQNAMGLHRRGFITVKNAMALYGQRRAVAMEQRTVAHARGFRSDYLLNADMTT